MSKPLESMTNEELWLLFPIILSEPCSEWLTYYQQEKEKVIDAVGAHNIYRINHIGSTSIEGLMAKPTVDILLEVYDTLSDEAVISALAKIGYRYSPQPNNPPPHMMFLKGYTCQGFADRVFHLHVRYPGDWNELYFRDYLRDHPNIAAAYGHLKQNLMKVFKHDRDGYTKEKTDFIQEITDKARLQYNSRYMPTVPDEFSSQS